MYIIVSNNPRIPIDLDSFQVDRWDSDTFIERASSDEGINIDEGIWYDVSCLTQDVYEALCAYKEAGVNLVYYRFEDTPNVAFPMMDKVKTYSVTPIAPPPPPEPEPIPEPTPEPVIEVPTPQPIIEQPTPPPISTPATVKEVASIPAPVAPPAPVTPPTPAPTQNLNNGIVNLNINKSSPDSAISDRMHNMLQYDDFDVSASNYRNKAKPANVILFGSSKGGTGKTFTCLISAYWYAKTHPTKKVALADFDIIDGQIGISINKLTPTMQDFYKIYRGNKQSDFSYLDNCKVKSDHFSPNIDFYLAPSQDIPEITNDTEYWNTVFKLLITNYDTVFFDSGIDYLGKAPISQLYKIADKIIITCNPSINSVKSVIKQFKTLSGRRLNNVFRETDDILSRVNVVLTRVNDNQQDIIDIVIHNISSYAPIITAFGNIDDIISQVQWYQKWELIDNNKDITNALEDITSFKEG